MTSAAANLGAAEMFVEPFAGGASTSLRLAGAGAVKRVILADADPLVARFWQVTAADTDWLIDRMYEEPVTLERWDYWRRWTPRRLNDRDVAVKCLFLNRTTFSGILHGRAGPIGGRTQTSPYKIDCRFNKPALEARLRFVKDLYASGRLLDVWCKSWEDTLADVAEHYPQLLPDRVIAYLDPPYLLKSPKLYARSFDRLGGYSPKAGSATHMWEPSQHLRLAEYLRTRAQYRWMLSYGDEPEVLASDGMYAASRMAPGPAEKGLLGVKAWRIVKRRVELRYSAAGSQDRSATSELLLTTLPASCVPTSDRFHPCARPR